jgi:hypothetical protein
MLSAAQQEILGPRVQADMRQLTFRPNCIAGVWACASLLHLERDELVPAVSGIRNVLVSSGVLSCRSSTAVAGLGIHRSSGRKLRAGLRIGRRRTWTHRCGRLVSRSSSRRRRRFDGTDGSLGSPGAADERITHRCTRRPRRSTQRPSAPCWRRWPGSAHALRDEIPFNENRVEVSDARNGGDADCFDRSSSTTPCSPFRQRLYQLRARRMETFRLPRVHPAEISSE